MVRIIAENSITGRYRALPLYAMAAAVAYLHRNRQLAGNTGVEQETVGSIA